MPRAWLRRSVFVLIFVLLQPFLVLAHESLVLVTGSLLDIVTQAGVTHNLIRPFLASPVYAQLAAETVGGIDPRGLAIAGWLGRLFHALLPRFFLSPDLVASGALVSAVMGRNSTVLSLFMTLAVVELAMVLCGAVLLRAALRRGPLLERLREPGERGLVCIALGLEIEVQAIWSLFGLTLAPRFARLEETGIGVVLSLFLRVTPRQYGPLMQIWLPLFIPLGLLAVCLGAMWLGSKLVHRSTRLFATTSVRATRPGHRRFLLTQLLVMAVAAPFATTTIARGYFGLAQTNLVATPDPYPASYSVEEVALVSTPVVVPETAAPSPMPTTLATATLTERPVPTQLPDAMASPRPSTAAALAQVVQATPTAESTPTPALAPTRRPSPTLPARARVQVQRTEHGLVLTLNGHPVTITGMNYNVNYTGFAPEIKLARHRRDFQIMRDAGVNVVIGWGVYDRVTLDVAREYGIGVVMPFELDSQGPYENENYRNELKDAYRKYVLEYRDHPALWAWNPGGDELLHRMDTEQHRTTDKLQAAADFLVELSQLAYSLDPDHVSIVKEPRDWYIPHLDVALKKVRAQPAATEPAQYFVYAVNVYGDPEQVATAFRTARRNAEKRLDVGLIVGEFAPFGLPREDRARHFGTIWDELHSTVRNGGFVYVYGPDQPNPQAPNPYDPLRLLVNEFSLVDIEGNPVDDSLAALAARWHQLHEARTGPAAPAAP